MDKHFSLSFSRNPVKKKESDPLNSEKLIQQVRLLMKSNSSELGFIPISAIEEQHFNGLVYHQFFEGEWVGYLVVGSIRAHRPVHIWQECIDKSARKLGSGKALFKSLLIKCLQAGASEIILRCAEDLESQLFWQALGFEIAGVQWPENKRKRAILTYRMIVTPNLFDNPSIHIPRLIDVKSKVTTLSK
jgi:GNAT superfamily N-acetyltransferase